MSHTQLHRKLVALTGEPPIRLIRQLRIERAKRLLEDNNLNISEVAFKTGFNSAAYFSRTFKTDVGLSPSQYRNKNIRDL